MRIEYPTYILTQDEFHDYLTQFIEVGTVSPAACECDCIRVGNDSVLVKLGDDDVHWMMCFIGDHVSHIYECTA